MENMNWQILRSCVLSNVKDRLERCKRGVGSRSGLQRTREVRRSATLAVIGKPENGGSGNHALISLVKFLQNSKNRWWWFQLTTTTSISSSSSSSSSCSFPTIRRVTGRWVWCCSAQSNKLASSFNTSCRWILHFLWRFVKFRILIYTLLCKYTTGKYNFVLFGFLYTYFWKERRE